METFLEKIKDVQSRLVHHRLDGWLLYDFRQSNPLAYTFLELAPHKMLTRRFFYWIPQKGDIIKIVSAVEPYTLDHLPGLKWVYQGWEELEKMLFSLAIENKTIAMEYSPYNALPAVSRVDAGTIELVRRMGAQVMSSANLLQHYTSVWTEHQWRNHVAAAEALNAIVDQTWAFIELSLRKQMAIHEYHVQQFMLNEMHRRGCITADPPICAVNAHSADPHYQPKETGSARISPGDFILLDLWCKKDDPQAVYADISRVGVAASKPSSHHEAIFRIVKNARDLATAFIKSHYEQGLSMQGWEVDQICREAIKEAGYANHFIHRTGHNIGTEVHGPGANLDNLETHDFRELIKGTCFSVEPGIYLPDQFGVRLEYDIYLNPNGHMDINGGIQENIVCIDVI